MCCRMSDLLRQFSSVLQLTVNGSVCVLELYSTHARHIAAQPATPLMGPRPAPASPPLLEALTITPTKALAAGRSRLKRPPSAAKQLAINVFFICSGFGTRMVRLAAGGTADLHDNRASPLSDWITSLHNVHAGHMTTHCLARCGIHLMSQSRTSPTTTDRTTMHKCCSDITSARWEPSLRRYLLHRCCAYCVRTIYCWRLCNYIVTIVCYDPSVCSDLQPFRNRCSSISGPVRRVF